MPIVPSSDSDSLLEIKRQEKQLAGINVLLFRRLSRLLPFLFPKIWSIPTSFFAVLLFVCFLEQYVVYQVGLISSRYYMVLGAKDWSGFVGTTLSSIGLVVGIALVLTAKTYLSSVLYIVWRRLLSQGLHAAYFASVNYYAITMTPSIDLDNPDMRMTQDVDLLCRTLGTMVATLIISPFKIGYYTYQAYSGTGWLGPTMILCFFLVSSIVNRFVMNPIVPCVVQSEKCEGDLRFKHMQIRSGSESVAFHVSGQVEAAKTNIALEQLVQAKLRLFNRQCWLNLCQNLFDYLGSILSYLAIAVPIFTGVYDNVDDTTLSSIISKNGFVCIMLISSLGSIVALCGDVVQLAGATHRVSYLLEALHKLDRTWQTHNKKADASFTNLTSGNEDGNSSGGIAPQSGITVNSEMVSAGTSSSLDSEPSNASSSEKTRSALLKPQHSLTLQQATFDANASNSVGRSSPVNLGGRTYSLVTPCRISTISCGAGSLSPCLRSNDDCRSQRFLSENELSVNDAPGSNDNEFQRSCDIKSFSVVTDREPPILYENNCLDEKYKRVKSENTSDIVSKEETEGCSVIATNNSDSTEWSQFSTHCDCLSSASFKNSMGFLLQNVTLCVPYTNDVLIKDISLTITRGCNLLIMGPSSSGKTSLLRALRGLWPIHDGVLAYQRHSGTKFVMFLPQKPFLTNGTLREQIIYPEQMNTEGKHTKRITNLPQAVIDSPNNTAQQGCLTNQISASDIEDSVRADAAAPTNDSDAGVLNLIYQVHMKSLLERCGGLDNNPGWVWSDVLSPGEIQRLCFLRVLYHRPHFAILDEATCALSTDAESLLYELAATLGITVISVGHRDTLRAHHRQLLTLDGKTGWSISAI